MKSFSKLMVVTGLLISNNPAAAETTIDVDLSRETHISIAVDGCVAAIIRPIIAHYVKRAKEVDDITLSEAEAKESLVKNPRWKNEMQPLFHEACSCLVNEVTQGAESVKDIQKSLYEFQEKTKSHTLSKDDESKVKACFDLLSGGGRK